MKQMDDEATHLSQATTFKSTKTSKAKKRQKESKKNDFLSPSVKKKIQILAAKKPE